MKLTIPIGIVLLLLLAGCQTATTNTTQSTGQIIFDNDDFVLVNDTNQSMVDDVPSTTINKTEPEPDVAYTIEVVEGELVKLNLQAVDPDGDSLKYDFTSPLNAQGRWQTAIGDEGRYLTTVTASDGKLSTSEDVLIIVNRANRGPVIDCPDEMKVKEGETLVLDCTIYDEEGDNILVSYEGWMSSSSKKTTYDDAGTYTVLIRASDGTSKTTKTVTVVVEDVNRPPVIAEISDITVMETNKVVVVPQVSDPDNDDLTVGFSSPLAADGTWETVDGDAGTYTITVTASDGQSTTTSSFNIAVTQINSAPVLKPIKDITVDEGDEIKLPINAYDPEGDELIITYSGYMDSDYYVTDFTDAGVYDQTVTVSDGVLSTTQSFTITVRDKNRPPEFVLPR